MAGGFSRGLFLTRVGEVVRHRDQDWYAIVVEVDIEFCDLAGLVTATPCLTHYGQEILDAVLQWAGLGRDAVLDPSVDPSNPET